ncbi:MAG: FAD-dependent oxidoreductase, partial [Candidatus Babeliaceae bacterium]|nr:FAD-dependent oxidoreductase [Candidatus Babeliaceae bacterium]
MSIKLIVIGGVAGGATAAARARRLDEQAEIILFERGEYISFANCGLPYYIGNIIKERADLLVTTSKTVRDRYHIDVRTFSEVLEIDRTKKDVAVKNHKTGGTYREHYDKIILAPGSEPIKPPLEGINLKNVFNLRNIPDSEHIKAYIKSNKPKAAVIVGGGFIGLEMAENLLMHGIDTTIVELLDQVMAPFDFEMASLLNAHLKEHGIRLELNDGVEKISQKADRLSVTTKKGKKLECDIVILSIGVKPENRLAKEAGLEIGSRGGIKVDAGMRTSDPHIYAVGDAVEVRDFVTGLPITTPLAGPANKQGRIAADNALGRREIFKGTLGTSIVKVFEMAAASTGMSEKILKKHEIPYTVSYTHSGSHASYYPGATMMAIKLIFQPANGKMLGAQIVGGEGVDKRIDVFATAICGGMTVHDLETLELAYAPPYGSAKDPVNIAGYVAANILKGDLDNVYWNQLPETVRDGCVLIDLRNEDELQTAGKIPGAVNIPLPQLRDKLPELDKSKTYIPFCAVGLRGYIGYRILVQNGFMAKNLSGGFRTYIGTKEKVMKESPGTRVW